ncbi:MAG: reverse transcriptase family protein [Flavobacteriales bacterium]
MISVRCVQHAVKPVLCRPWRTANWEAINLKLAEITLPKTSNVEEVAQEWYSSIQAVIEEFVPERRLPMRKYRSPFMTSEIKTIKFKRDKLIRKAKKYNLTDEEWLNLKTLKKQVTSRLRREMKEQGKQALSSQSTSSGWKFIKQSMFSVKDRPKAFIEPKELNLHFARIVKSQADNFTLESISTCDEEDAFAILPPSQLEVERTLKKIKSKTAPGHDNIPGFLLSNCAKSITPSLTHLFDLCISTASFPTAWKKANTTAIWKGKGSKYDANNYRPISVLPIVARTFEKLVCNQLSQFCENRSILPSSQYGFRQRSSCEIALIKATDTWMAKVDQGKIVGALLLDLSKAFDTVPHQKLLSELSKINMASTTLNFFNSYLSNRLQRIVSCDQLTPWQSIGRGVPQGSCLSPLLFNIYVRDLPKDTTGDPFQYADDCTLSASGDSTEKVIDILTEDYNRTSNFCEEKELILNESKTQFIIFKQPTKKLDTDTIIQLGTAALQPLNEVKLLGFMLDRHLTFESQIKAVTTKARGLLSILRLAAKSLPQELTLLAYQGLIRSHLEYCSGVFVGMAETHAHKLEVIQKIAARIICDAPRDAHAQPLLASLKLEELRSRRNAHTLNIITAIRSNQTHPSFLNFFDTNDTAPRTRIGKRRFSMAAEALLEDLIS